MGVVLAHFIDFENFLLSGDRSGIIVWLMKLRQVAAEKHVTLSIPYFWINYNSNIRPSQLLTTFDVVAEMYFNPIISIIMNGG